MSKLKWEQLKGRCRRVKDIATFGPERKPPVEQSILPRTKQQNDPICKRCGCVTRRKTHDGPVPGKTMWYAWWFRCSRCGWQFMPKEAIRTLPSTPTREADVYDLAPASSFIRRETPALRRILCETGGYIALVGADESKSSRPIPLWA